MAKGGYIFTLRPSCPEALEQGARLIVVLPSSESHSVSRLTVAVVSKLIPIVISSALQALGKPVRPFLDGKILPSRVVFVLFRELLISNKPVWPTVCDLHF